MKRVIFLLLLCVAAISSFAQQPPPKISPKEGKDVLMLLPESIKGLNAIKEKDRVLDAKGKQGVMARRQYGNTNRPVYFLFINQSISLPTVLSAMAAAEGKATERQEVTVIKGYKAFIERTQGEDGTTSYQVLIPLRDNLLVLQGKAYVKSEMIDMATSLPLAEIDKKLQ